MIESAALLLTVLLPNPCYVALAHATVLNNTIVVNVTYERLPFGKFCIQMVVVRQIKVDLGPLRPGTYTLVINEVRPRPTALRAISRG